MSAATPPAVQDGDSVWMRTCIHHTDAQRNTANQCPVCILRERDTLASQLAQAQEEVKHNDGRAARWRDRCDELEVSLTAARAECERLREVNARAQGRLESLSKAIDIAEQINASQSDQQIALSASLSEALAHVLKESAENERDQLRAENADYRTALVDIMVSLDAGKDPRDCEDGAMDSPKSRARKALAKHQQADT